MTNDDAGVFYMLTGKGHGAVCAVSVFNLANVWNGRVCIAAGDQDALDIATKIASDANRLSLFDDVLVKEWNAPRGRNMGYLAKTQMCALSPFERTVFIDADTLPVAHFDELWPRTEAEVVFTQFAKWVSNQRPINRRIGSWQQFAPEEYTRCITEEWPALNTGIMAFTKAAMPWFHRWDEMARRNISFICDELAAQLLLPSTPEARVVDQRFNCSPNKSVLNESEHPVIYHFHGRSHAKIRKGDKGWPIWSPALRRTVELNFAGIRSWARAYDGHLNDRLNELEKDGDLSWTNVLSPS